jgi:hypothetical protein
LGTTLYLALQEIAVKAQMFLLVRRNFREHVAEFTRRQVPGQQVVVTDADHLGSEQYHHFEPESDNSATENKKARGPVLAYQLAAQRTDAAGEQLGMPMFFGDEQRHRLGIVMVDLRYATVPRLLHDAATA